MRYRTIDVRLWGDEKFRALSPLQPSAQALFIYLLTNPNTTSIPGLYRAGAAALAEELAWPLEGFFKAFQEISSQGLVRADFDARVVYIPNAIRYNKPQSPNVVISWLNHWDEIPECDLRDAAYQEIKAFLEDMGEAFAEAFLKPMRKPCRKAMPNQEQEQEHEQEKKEDICEVKTSPVTDSPSYDLSGVKVIFEHWQQVMNHPHSKLDKKRKVKITKALELGYSVDDLMRAIDGCAKTPYNMGQNDLGQRYDDIELILRDASHIERFINNFMVPPVSANQGRTVDIMAGVI